MMGWAVLVQRRGLGSRFQCDVQVSIVSASSATEVWVRPLRALRARMENQPSTRLAHDALVGVK